MADRMKGHLLGYCCNLYTGIGGQFKTLKAPRARPVACVGNDVGCIAGEAGTGALVGGAAVVADERPDVGSNRAAAASAGDSALVSGVLTGGEG